MLCCCAAMCCAVLRLLFSFCVLHLQWPLHAATARFAALPCPALYSLGCWVTTWPASQSHSTVLPVCPRTAPVGGTLGDRMARNLPNSPNGRILTNQLSVLIGLPLSFVLLKGGKVHGQGHGCCWKCT